MTFEKCIPIILDLEGGYTNDPVDRGGETNFGIAKKFYPNVDIKNLTKERAIEIYKKDYWDVMGVERLPQHLRLIVFDCGVNCGRTTAISLLQDIAGVRRDGIIGKVTVAAAKEVSVKEYADRRRLYYSRVVANDPSQDKFLKGWLNRVKIIESKSKQKKMLLSL
jgi:lysozyme family protein